MNITLNVLRYLLVVDLYALNIVREIGVAGACSKVNSLGIR